LQRRLAEAGVRYADLLDSCRADMALEYLEGSSMPIINLAHMLGYSDQSAFNHAFRRWHGVSPTAWTERNKSQGA
jgi:AraC-like DNA-binding protein